MGYIDRAAGRLMSRTTRRPAPRYLAAFASAVFLAAACCGETSSQDHQISGFERGAIQVVGTIAHDGSLTVNTYNALPCWSLSQLVVMVRDTTGATRRFVLEMDLAPLTSVNTEVAGAFPAGATASATHVREAVGTIRPHQLAKDSPLCRPAAIEERVAEIAAHPSAKQQEVVNGKLTCLAGYKFNVQLVMEASGPSFEANNGFTRVDASPVLACLDSEASAVALGLNPGIP